MNFTKKYLDFCFNKENLIALFALVLSAFLILFFDLREIYENSLLENVQLIILFASFIYCFRAKKYKIFFHIVAMVVFLMFLREISYGRVFLPKPPGGGVDAMYPWSHYKYGFLVDYIVGLYIAVGTLYGIIKKVWIDIFEIVKNIKFPFWSLFSGLICVIIQIVSEGKFHNSCIEETAELVLYCLIFAVIAIYVKKINSLEGK